MFGFDQINLFALLKQPLILTHGHFQMGIVCLKSHELCGLERKSFFLSRLVEREMFDDEWSNIPCQQHRLVMNT